MTESLCVGAEATNRERSVEKAVHSWQLENESVVRIECRRGTTIDLAAGRRELGSSVSMPTGGLPATVGYLIAWFFD